MTLISVHLPAGLRRALLGPLLVLAACSSQPPTPDWQINAQGAAQKALVA